MSLFVSRILVVFSNCFVLFVFMSKLFVMYQMNCIKSFTFHWKVYQIYFILTSVVSNKRCHNINIYFVPSSKRFYSTLSLYMLWAWQSKKPLCINKYEFTRIMRNIFIYISKRIMLLKMKIIRINEEKRYEII